jgi:CsoR family transcriptional regulator, copper-sensing transcriptional repressor
MNKASKQTISVRLKRVEGQVRGIARMVDDDRYCIDVLTQIAAVCAALRKVEQDILKDHLSCCVAGSFKRGNVQQQQDKIKELTTILSKITK